MEVLSLFFCFLRFFLLSFFLSLSFFLPSFNNFFLWGGRVHKQINYLHTKHTLPGILVLSIQLPQENL